MNRGHILKDYYSIKDTEGTLHSGFLAALDFSGVSLPILNEVTISLLDAHVYNALSRIKALNQWDSYLEYDEDQKEWHIDKTFYDDFVTALEVELMTADKELETLVSFNFKSLTAQEQETIVYGAKETQRDYDKVVVEVTRGNDTEGQTARTDTHEDDAYIDTHANTARTDTQEIGNRTDTETPGQATVTNKLYPLGASGFIDDTQSITSQQQTSRTQGAQTIENETGAQTVTDNMGKQKTTDTYGAQTTTRTWGDTQTETDARQDVETIKTRTDMKTRTKVILISPEKLFEIQKELAEVNAYTLFTNAVRRAFGAAFFLD